MRMAAADYPMTPDLTFARKSRGLPLLALSLLLHLMLLAAFDGSTGAPALAPPARVITALLTAPPPAPVAPPIASEPLPVVNTPKKTPQVRRKLPAPSVAATPAALPVVPVLPALPEPAAPSAEITPQPLQSAAVADSPGAIVPADKPVPAVVPEAGTAAAAPPAPHYKVSLPPSAALAYEVRYATKGNITRGSSVIEWRRDGANYAIRGEVSKFGFALSSFRSEGSVDEAGVAPVLYAEKNARRAETNTHFSRDARQAISFSASADAYALTPGAQDRASILWQLAGIGRADQAVFVAGTVLDVFVAGVRDAEHWLIDVVGEETVTLETGEARAWHLVRAPRAGTYDKRIDIWLAPAQQWYPVKLRYTEISGDYLDLSLAAVR